MAIPKQKIVPERRSYNQWVVNETLEDFALRFTARKARGGSIFRVTNTALGTVSFLVLEAIGASITLAYGFTNALTAILAVGIVIFLLGLPLSYHAARNGLDVDLLTRGAGFGYVGSTVTSLIYASFTFIFFALEAAIMALALEMWLGIPTYLGYLVTALVVLPLVTHGFTYLSKFQTWTQPVWLMLQILAVISVVNSEALAFADWTTFTGQLGDADTPFNILLFASACSIIFPLVAQNAEQVDYQRFMPVQTRKNRLAWWISVVAAGPGWVIPGVLKMLLGSFFAVLLLSIGFSFEQAGQPTEMYLFAFGQAFGDTGFAIGLAAIFVILSQLKINVTNAYAGSIAWSNFFARLTHSHPGRVVWLFFNVSLALMLMELGIYQTFERTLSLYANIPLAWMATVAADLAINKPLGLSPRKIEFRRAYLHNFNPVGPVSMAIASLTGIAIYAGLAGIENRPYATLASLVLPFFLAPLIAWLSKGKYYLARPVIEVAAPGKETECCICQNPFESEDMASCPVYGAPICSLCCALDARCHDACKSHDDAPGEASILHTGSGPSPQFNTSVLNARLFKYLGALAIGVLLATILLSLTYLHLADSPGLDRGTIEATLFACFIIIVFVIAIAIWPFLLAKESSLAARLESNAQTDLLYKEIRARQDSDAELQQAKDVAEARNEAKTKYVQGTSHELRTPLNAILGYAQLLETKPGLPRELEHGLSVIRRSGAHLSSLVDGLLDISMIEAGKFRTYTDEIQIRDFLDQLVDMFTLQALDKGLSFVFEQPEHMARIVRVDEKRLRQVLINLVSNAIRYTHAGSVTLRLSYSGEVARFDIIDTGVGIVDDDLDRIFVPFERLDSPQRAKAKGSGLGLTITKLLVEAMGGEITVTSQPGAGSCFTVRIFLPAITHPTKAEKKVRTPIVGYEGPKRTILIVDDDTHHLDFMREALSQVGLFVLTEDSGEGCLVTAGTCSPDAVLLDISLPGIDGWAVARELRKRADPNLKIIMVSANARNDPKRAEEAEFHDAYLMKPVHIPTLMGQLKSIFGLEWVYRSSSEAEEADPEAVLPTKLPTLAAADITNLLELAQIGHAKGILDALDDISIHHPEAELSLNRMRVIAESCDFDTLQIELQKLLEND
ncbi:MAG: ATP-binding protein [Candidatus Phaeomarinobacter sp.]